MTEEAPKPKPVRWVGSSLDDLRECPPDVQDAVGYALWLAQKGEKHPRAKPLRGFGGAAVQEVVVDDPSGTYRGVYTVKFADAVYVLHVFQKKSKSGIATPKEELDRIRRRFKEAKNDHEERSKPADPR